MDDRTLLERDEAQLCKACNVWVRPGDDCIPRPEGCIVAVGEVACLNCAANHYCPTHNPAPAGARKEWCPECNEAICPGCDAASLAEGEAK